jgi:hypothetical protein
MHGKAARSFIFSDVGQWVITYSHQWNIRSVHVAWLAITSVAMVTPVINKG